MVTRTQKVLLVLLGFCLAAPWPLMLVTRGWSLPKESRWNWLGNRTLQGVTLPKSPVPLSHQTWFGGEYQRDVTAWFNERFGGREAFIRGNNQILWSLFGKSYMSQESVLLGRRQQLFESGYVKYHLGWARPMPEGDLDALAGQAAELQRRLRERGVAFAVFITPSKAEVYPDDVPEVYDRPTPNAQPPREADRFIAALQRQKVAVSDGRAALRRHARQFHGQPFPATGVHWSHPAAAFALADLLQVLAASSKVPRPSLAVENVRVTATPGQADQDLAQLLNLMTAPMGTYLEADYRLSVPSGGTITFVGGSFLHTTNSILDRVRAFQRLRHYHYFKVHVQTFPGGKVDPVDVDAIPWQEDFAQAEAVVLEVNEVAVAQRHPPVFLSAALAALPPLVTPDSVRVQVAEGWHDIERDPASTWNWSRATTSELEVVNPAAEPRPVRLRFSLFSRTPGKVRLLAPDGRVLLDLALEGNGRGPLQQVTWQAPPGRSRLRFETDVFPTAASPTDARLITYGLFDLRASLAD